MSREQLEKHRTYVRARISTVSTRCPICIQKNTNGLYRVLPIAELHHIFGRARNPTDVRESIFGLMGLCNVHHREYPPLLSVNEYVALKEKWDNFFEVYWGYIGLFSFMTDVEREFRKKLFDFTTEELITYFLGGNSIG